MDDPPQIVIVLIEDEPVSSRLMQLELEKHGYTVVPFFGGVPALKYLDLHRVDLVLTDIFLPDLDGVDVIRTIRETNSATPIIAMSSEPETQNVSIRNLAKQAGCNHFFEKPVPKKELLAKMASLI